MVSKQFKGKKFNFLIELFLSEFNSTKNVSTLSSIEKHLGHSPGSPDTRSVLKFLIVEDVLIESGQTWNSAMLYYVDRKTLKKIIESQEIYKLCYKYFIYNIP